MATHNLSNAAAATASITGLARALNQHGWLSDEMAAKISQRAQKEKTDILDAVLSENIQGITAGALARFCSEAFGHPLLDLLAIDLDGVPTDLIEPKNLATWKAVPLKKRGNHLFVAMSDPTNLQTINQIQFQTQMVVDPIVVEHDKLCALIDKLSTTSMQALGSLSMTEADLENITTLDSPGATDDATSDADDAPIVRFLQSVLAEAVNQGASDLHFEPYEKIYRIRYRVDGILNEVAAPPISLKERIAARLKIISKLDISEKRVPQDGRLKLNMGGNKVIDFRVSTLPTLFGEKIVMRILDPSQAKLGIDALGYDPAQKEKLMFAVGRPYGMILVTGPTGSGKTVSLYTCLNILNVTGTNISTAEDPAEINLPGVNQVNINDKAGLTFPVALKAFLRQDPDVIMVGEIRDLETADIAIKAAQTGHLVFSTLHTNDAPATLTRLLNMGVAPFNIASSVILITGQRLARRLCTCKQVGNFTPTLLKSFGFKEVDQNDSWKPYVPIGCERCKGTGYKGRVGIYQVMPITEEMQKIILAHGSALEISHQAKAEGILSLRESGLEKVKQGVTSIEEVLAVTNE